MLQPARRKYRKEQKGRNKGISHERGTAVSFGEFGLKAIGRGRITDGGELIPLDVNVGDRVLIGKYAGTEITLDGTEYLIVREDEILGVVEPVREPVAAQIQSENHRTKEETTWP